MKKSKSSDLRHGGLLNKKETKGECYFNTHPKCWSLRRTLHFLKTCAARNLQHLVFSLEFLDIVSLKSSSSRTQRFFWTNVNQNRIWVYYQLSTKFRFWFYVPTFKVLNTMTTCQRIRVIAHYIKWSLFWRRP